MGKERTCATDMTTFKTTLLISLFVSIVLTQANGDLGVDPITEQLLDGIAGDSSDPTRTADPLTQVALDARVTKDFDSASAITADLGTGSKTRGVLSPTCK